MGDGRLPAKIYRWYYPENGKAEEKIAAWCLEGSTRNKTKRTRLEGS